MSVQRFNQIAFLFLLVGAQSASALELACQHLVPIQIKFISRHINYSKLDANLEKRTIDQFVKSLDPSKVYLTQADKNKITASMQGIYNKSRAGDCKPIDEAFSLVTKRMSETSDLAKKYLGDGFKLDKTTKILLDSDKRDYAKTEKARQDFIKKYLQLQVANYVATDTPVKEARERITKNYERALKRMKGEDQADRLSVYLNAFAGSLDPHSTYWSQDSYDDFKISIGLSLEGIGATLSSKDGFTVIEQLLPGGAASKSGQLRSKDSITAVAEGENGPFVDVIDQDLRDVVKKIRGKKNTKVRLSILRKSGDETKKFQVTLVRDKIDLKDEAAQVHYMDQKLNGKTAKVALINLPTFYSANEAGGRSASADLRKILRDVRKNKVDAVVLDLSTNGGGSLDEAVDVAGLFFRSGNVVKQSSRSPLQGELALADEDPVVHYSGPLILLTSRISASASEIVAGTLKDYKRALIVGGDHTYGKGTVQAVENLPPGLGALKTTIGMFFTSGGQSTQHVGVDSDIELPSVWTTDEVGEKTLDYSLPPRKIKPFLSAEAFVASGPSVWKTIDNKSIKKLKEESAKRVAESDDFKKIKETIAKNKNRKEVLISDILDDKNKDDDPDADSDDVSPNDKDGKPKGYAQLQKERLEKYLKRADVVEAAQIAADLSILLAGGDLKLARKDVDNTPSHQVEKSPTKN